MALNPKLANASATAAANSVAALCNSGTIKIYDSTGTGQPATADTAVSTQVLLVTLTFSATAFPTAVNGVATANAITSGTAVATGTATWFRVLTSGAATVFDGSVGTATSDLVFGTVSFVTGATIDISSFSYTQSKV